MTKEQEAFWLRVDKKAPSECWEWLGNRGLKGYGCFVRHGAHSSKRAIKAHRYSYILHNGEITNGLWVLHKCNNPSCVNPFHLKLGTAQDNACDRDTQGRHYSKTKPECINRGSKIGTSKLTEECVKEIRWLMSHGLTAKATAEIYGVTAKHASLLHSGRQVWQHILPQGGR